eukprot:3301743-Pleurochrysis_carterae.AAC.1
MRMGAAESAMARALPRHHCAAASCSEATSPEMSERAAPSSAAAVRQCDGGSCVKSSNEASVRGLSKTDVPPSSACSVSAASELSGSVSRKAWNQWPVLRLVLVCASTWSSKTAQTFELARLPR